MQNYLSKKLDSDILELMPHNPFDLIINDGFNHYDKKNKTKIWYEPLSKVFDDVKIEYTNNWWCKIGKSIFCHPSAYSSGTLKTTEKAMQYFNCIDRDYDSIFMAHTHQQGFTKKGKIYLYEQGTCSDINKMDYMDGRLSMPQQMGFIYVCQDINGNLIEDKTKLISL